MKYQLQRRENDQWITKLSCDFEDEQFSMIALAPAYRILCNGKDVTKNYKKTTKRRKTAKE